MNIPANLKYTEDHEWVKIEGKRATIGLTDFAQKELGDIVYVELPGVDDETEAGESFCSVESTKAASDVYAPVAGRVVEVNGALEDQPELINEDPYGKGWVAVIEFSDDATLDGLLDATAYGKTVKE